MRESVEDGHDIGTSTYTIVQGQGRQLWKWGFAVHSKPPTGEAATKADAVSEAELAIDRSLSLEKLRVVRQS